MSSSLLFFVVFSNVGMNNELHVNEQTQDMYVNKGDLPHLDPLTHMNMEYTSCKQSDH